MRENNRQGILELWRFIASLLIVATHLRTLGFDGNYPFRASWIWVEFFFIVTGYFTMVHFSKEKNNSVDEIIKSSVLYTLKKFRVIFPYVLFSVTCKYILDYIGAGFKRLGIGHLVNYIFDVLLLSSNISEQHVAIGPHWYLSALIISFPIFCIAIQVIKNKSKYLLYVLSFYLPFFYHAYTKEGLNKFPLDLIRALAGLFLGVFVYALAFYIKRLKLTEFVRVVLTITEVAVLVLLIVAQYHCKVYARFSIFCFVVVLGIIFSRQSYTVCIKGRVFDYLGQISMVIYIFHYVVIYFISKLFSELDIREKIIMTYLGTLICSVIIQGIVERVRRKR